MLSDKNVTQNTCERSSTKIKLLHRSFTFHRKEPQIQIVFLESVNVHDRRTKKKMKGKRRIYT